MTPGRLFQLQLQRSAAARKDALDSIRDLRRGGVSVRIGGRMKGQTVRCVSRKDAEQRVAEHYDAALMAQIHANNRRAAMLAALDTGADA